MIFQFTLQSIGGVEVLGGKQYLSVCHMSSPPSPSLASAAPNVIHQIKYTQGINIKKLTWLILYPCSAAQQH